MLRPSEKSSRDGLSELPPVLGGTHAGDLAEFAAEGGGILVADALGDILDRPVGALEAALSLLDAEALDVVERRMAGRSPETSREAPVGEPDRRIASRTGEATAA